MSAELVLQDLTPDMLPLHPGLFDRHCFETSLLRRLPLPLSERDQRFVVNFGQIRIVQAGYQAP
jgi:hypothetical protein